MDVESTDSIADTLEAGFNEIVGGEDSQGSEGSEATTLSNENTGTEDGETADDNKSDGYEERYKELQSMTDKKLSEMQKAQQETAVENAKLKGMMEAIQTHQQGATNAEMAARSKAEQDAFDKNWADILEEEPGRVVEYQQAVAQELMYYNERKAEAIVEEKLKALDIENRLRQVQPGWKENQEKIQQTADELGVSLDVAQKIVDKYDAKGGKTSQPARPNAPGTVDEGKPQGKAQTVEAMPLSSADIEVMRLAGLDEKAIARAAKKAAQDIAGLSN